MSKTSVQVKLFQAGITQKAISDATGFSEVSVYLTLQFKRHNQIIQETAADLLNIPAAELWGEDYAPVRRKNKKSPRSAEPTDI